MDFNAIWGKDKSKEKNCTLGFVYDLNCNKGDLISVSINASNIYKLYIDNKLFAYGPARAAHGFSRTDKVEFKAYSCNHRITVEVVSYQVNSYYLVMEEPFFDCKLSVNDSFLVNANAFTCYHLNDRVQKVQRYSFQRPFVESYNGSQREALRLKQKVDYPILETCAVAKNYKYIPREVECPHFEEIHPIALLEEGSVEINESNPLWKDRSYTDIGNTLLGYTKDEIEEMISDEVCLFDYVKNGIGSNTYSLYEFPVLKTGLINLEIEVIEDTEVYLIFEEILWQENAEISKNAPLNLCFWRGECANIIKYKLKAGVYSLQSFEIYTLKYLKVVNIGGKIKINKVGITTIESPAAYKFKYQINDKKIECIINAAINTFSQNSLDLFMDCPSRERAGWTNDSYFTSIASILFTGEYLIEKNFIENVINSPDLKTLPSGMLPMCYPCDHIDGVYSPTCSMWFALEVIRYCRDALDGRIPESIKNKIQRLINYFDEYLNEDGLIEDLGGWVFIEWSIANDDDYVCGVNYPSNMLYYKLLYEFGSITEDISMIDRTENIKKKILEQSFNGKCFEDNRIRENGKLVLNGHISETCQYFAFYLGVAEKEKFPKLYKEIADNCKYEEIPLEKKDRRRSNIIIGLILRETLLLEDGRIEQVVEECKEILYRMASRTGTLWENVDIRASCNHNVASYFAVLLTYALTGYRGFKDGKMIINKKNAGIDCSFEFTHFSKPIKLAVKNGKIDIKTDYEVLYI